MNGENVDWLPALIVLVVGAVAGAFLAWSSSRRRGSRPAAGPALEARDQQGELESLLVQLRELDDQESKRTTEQIAAERAELEVRAARVLRDLERGVVAARPASTAFEPESEPAPPVAATGGGLRGFLWGAGSVAALALLLLLVTRGASDREAGGSPTGGSLAPQAQQQPASAPMVNIAELRRVVDAQPNDPEARMNLAQALLFSQDLRGVQEQTDAVLGRNPDHPRALSYGAIVQLSMGNADEALRMAARSVQLDPADPEARVHLALIHAQRGEQADAERVLEEAIRSFPSDASALQTILDDFRRAGAAAAPSAPAAAAPATSGVQIDVSVAGGGPSRGVVFVEARPAGNPDGAALAVRRESVGAFPVTLSLSDADSMSGSLPPTMRIDVRLDSDGNPVTHGPADRSGFAEGVAAGSRVAVTLQPGG